MSGSPSRHTDSPEGTGFATWRGTVRETANVVDDPGGAQAKHALAKIIHDGSLQDPGVWTEMVKGSTHDS